MLPVPLPGERFYHDILLHICHGNVIDSDEAAPCCLAAEVVAYVDLLCSIMELGIGGELCSSLVVSVDSLWLAPGGSSACRCFGASRIAQ